jgi:hypothetical protein
VKVDIEVLSYFIMVANKVCYKVHGGWGGKVEGDRGIFGASSRHA